MTIRLFYGILSMAIAIGGCAPGPLDDSAWPAPRPLGRDLEAYRPSAAAESHAPPAIRTEPTGTITLRDALAAALMQSPDLAATGYQVRAKEAEALQAAVLPNPEFGVELENFGGSGELDGFDAAETTLALSQLIELGGKRVARLRVAEHEARIAGWEYEVRRIDVLSKTAAEFVGLLAEERRLQMAIEIMELAQRVFDTVGERVDAGKVSPVERTKAQVELAQARLGQERAVRAVAAARTRLASNWGSTSPQFEALLGDFDRIDAVPNLDALLTRIDESPDLARWTAEAALRQAEVELVLAQRVPDLTASGGVRYFDEIDETAFVAGLALPLPILNGNDDGIRAARLRAIRTGRLEEAARVRMCSAVIQSYHALDSAYVTVDTTRRHILPSAERAFEAADEAFRQGKIDALDLLDAERTLFDARRQLTDALSTYHLAVIAGERLIGAPIHDGARSQGNDS